MKVYTEFAAFDDDKQNEIVQLMAVITKYRFMWELRHLENDIVNEGGSIIISVNPWGIKTRQFSQELTDKIVEIFKDFKPGY